MIHDGVMVLFSRCIDFPPGSLAAAVPMRRKVFSLKVSLEGRKSRTRGCGVTGEPWWKCGIQVGRGCAKAGRRCAWGRERSTKGHQRAHVMMRSPHLGPRRCGIVRGRQALSLLRAFLFFLISFLVCLNNRGFFFYVIMPVMSMRMTCRVRSF